MNEENTHINSGKIYLAEPNAKSLAMVGADALVADAITMGGVALAGTLPALPHRVSTANSNNYLYARTLGKKQYEIADHLGNVRATISDRRFRDADNDTYYPELLSTNTYYPFGMGISSLSVQGGYRFGFNGKELDNEWGLAKYDYGFRIYNPGIGKFLSVDPLTKDYPWYTPYQFAGNKPIAAIDLDGLEAKLAIYGTGKNNGDKSQFKKEADYDVKMHASHSPHFILTGQNFIKLLISKTKEEGSIGRLAIFSHSTPHGAYLDDTPGNYGGLLRSKHTGLNKRSKAYTNTQTTSEIAGYMISKDIIFDKNALVIFAGCNTGSSTDDNGTVDGLPLAKDFTMRTGVTSIGAVGSTAPKNDGTGSRTADEGYYMFERIKNDEGNYSVKSTFLSKSIDPSGYQFRESTHLKPMKSIKITSVESNSK